MKLGLILVGSPIQLFEYEEIEEKNHLRKTNIFSSLTM